jgi:Tol biopolymer transport system component
MGFSRSGTVAYPAGAYGSVIANPVTLGWVNRQGAEQPLSAAVRGYADPRISPDGGRVAIDIVDLGQTIDRHIWLLDAVRGTTSRLTFDQANMSPVWTPDGRRLIYTSASSAVSPRGALASVATDGSGQPETLREEGVARATATSVSPDGKFVIGSTGNDVWVLSLGGDPKTAKTLPFLDNRFTRAEFQFSPDGKWVAYQSNESGRNEIYVSPFPGPGGKFQVSSDGGTQPRWNRNGRELFFRSGAKMMAADTELTPTFRAGTPKMLFEKVSSDYDVHPDGKRFLMLKPAATTDDNSELHIILNWFEDLRKKVPLP